MKRFFFPPFYFSLYLSFLLITFSHLCFWVSVFFFQFVFIFSFIIHFHWFSLLFYTGSFSLILSNLFTPTFLAVFDSLPPIFRLFSPLPFIAMFLWWSPSGPFIFHFFFLKRICHHAFVLDLCCSSVGYISHARTYISGIFLHRVLLEISVTETCWSIGFFDIWQRINPFISKTSIYVNFPNIISK